MRASLGVALLCSALFSGLSAAAPARAVDLINADPQPHRMEVEEWGETFAFTIQPGMTLSDVCLVCTVRLIDGSDIAAEDNDTVVIRGGALQIGG